jgi:hypothetical protein
MEIIQKEWQNYARKEVLNNLYNEEFSKKLDNFLKNYNLLKCIATNKDQNELRIELLFGKRDENIQIIAQFESDNGLNWTIPYEFDYYRIEQVLDNFNFQTYI